MPQNSYSNKDLKRFDRTPGNYTEYGPIIEPETPSGYPELQGVSFEHQPTQDEIIRGAEAELRHAQQVSDENGFSQIAGLNERMSQLSADNAATAPNMRRDVRNLTEKLHRAGGATMLAAIPGSLVGAGPLLGAAGVALSAPDALRRLILPDEDESRLGGAAETALLASPAIYRGAKAGLGALAGTEAGQAASRGTSASMRAMNKIMTGHPEAANAQQAEMLLGEEAARMEESAQRAGEHAKQRFNARAAEKAGFPRSSVAEGLASDEPVGGNFLHTKAPRSISRDVSNPTYFADESIDNLGRSATTQARYPSIGRPEGGYPKRSLTELMNSLADNPEQAKKAFAPFGRGIGYQPPAPLQGENVMFPAMGRAPSAAAVAEGPVNFPAMGRAPLQGGANMTRPAMGRAPSIAMMEDALNASPEAVAQREARDMGGFAGPRIERGMGARTPEQASLHARATSAEPGENIAAKVSNRPRTPSVKVMQDELQGPVVESRAANASGGGMQGSLEETNRAKGQVRVVFDQKGEARPVHVDYAPQKGETTAILTKHGVEIQDANGGKVPSARSAAQKKGNPGLPKNPYEKQARSSMDDRAREAREKARQKLGLK